MIESKLVGTLTKKQKRKRIYFGHLNKTGWLD